MYEKYVKRILDIIISIILLIILLPVYFLISVAVLLTMGRPILFSQERIGKQQKKFRLYKFRSMTNEKDANGNLLNEQLRLTKFGIVLRSSSLDELPELFSILKGDMSFVGPRPLPTYYGPFFYEDEQVRHRVRGGLIPPDGLCGETTPTWEKQFEYDCYYTRHISLALDLKVIFATFKILLKRLKNNYGAEDRQHLSEYRKEEQVNEKGDSGI